MELNTARLRIIPLSLKQFQLLLNNTREMEVDLQLNCSNESLDEHTQLAMTGLYQEAVKNEEHYLWYTNWQIILKSENISIGSACFMKQPNDAGEVEIGYGINQAYRNKGYMSEAAKALCDWAMLQPQVTTIIAETDKINIASHKVVQQCKMEKYKESDSSYWWRLIKTNQPSNNE